MEETGILENPALLSLVLPDFEPGPDWGRAGRPWSAAISPVTRLHRLSGNVLLLPELRELTPEHLLGLDHVVKPVAAGLGGVGDGVVRDTEDERRIPRRRAGRGDRDAAH